MSSALKTPDVARLGPDSDDAGSGARRLPSTRPRAYRPAGSSLDPNGVPVTRILLADADSASRAKLRPRLAALATEVHESSSGQSLESALLEGGPFNVVVASARLPEPSALQVLARVRRHGLRTPFIVVTSVHGGLMRCFVSDTEGTVLSSRMLDHDNLSTLISEMLDETSRR